MGSVRSGQNRLRSISKSPSFEVRATKIDIGCKFLREVEKKIESNNVALENLAKKSQDVANFFIPDEDGDVFFDASNDCNQVTQEEVLRKEFDTILKEFNGLFRETRVLMKTQKLQAEIVDTMRSEHLKAIESEEEIKDVVATIMAVSLISFVAMTPYAITFNAWPFLSATALLFQNKMISKGIDRIFPKEQASYVKKIARMVPAFTLGVSLGISDFSNIISYLTTNLAFYASKSDYAQKLTGKLSNSHTKKNIADVMLRSVALTTGNLVGIQLENQLYVHNFPLKAMNYVHQANAVFVENPLLIQQGGFHFAVSFMPPHQQILTPRIKFQDDVLQGLFIFMQNIGVSTALILPILTSQKESLSIEDIQSLQLEKCIKELYRQIQSYKPISLRTPENENISQ